MIEVLKLFTKKSKNNKKETFKLSSSGSDLSRSSIRGDNNSSSFAVIDLSAPSISNNERAIKNFSLN